MFFAAATTMGKPRPLMGTVALPPPPVVEMMGKPAPPPKVLHKQVK
jgi:hypothetical protein